MRRRKKKPVGSSEQERRSLSRQLFRPLATASCCRPAHVSAFSGESSSGLSARGGAPWCPLSCLCRPLWFAGCACPIPSPPGPGDTGAPTQVSTEGYGAGSSGKTAATCLQRSVNPLESSPRLFYPPCKTQRSSGRAPPGRCGGRGRKAPPPGRWRGLPPRADGRRQLPGKPGPRQLRKMRSGAVR